MISKLRKNKEETKKKVKKHNYNINQDYNMSQDYNINQENSRSKKYTKLLKKYVKNTEKSLALKLTLKKSFFLWNKFNFSSFDNFICSDCYCFSIKL